MKNERDYAKEHEDRKKTHKRYLCDLKEHESEQLNKELEPYKTEHTNGFKKWVLKNLEKK